MNQHSSRRLMLLLGFFCSTLVLSTLGCGEPPSTVRFTLRGVSKPVVGAASKDGIFLNKCCEYRIVPSQIWVVLGDLHLTAQEPNDLRQIYTSLKPLLAPGESIPADQIGVDGKFPGLWAINLTPGLPAHNFPQGQVVVQTWKSLNIRFAPAVRGIRGVADQVLGSSLLMEGTAEKDQLKCNFKASLRFEGGIGQRILFAPLSNQNYNPTIEVNYARWLDDVRFQDLCTANGQTIEISQQKNPQYADKIKSAFFDSITVQMEANAAQP